MKTQQLRSPAFVAGLPLLLMALEACAPRMYGARDRRVDQAAAVLEIHPEAPDYIEYERTVPVEVEVSAEGKATKATVPGGLTPGRDDGPEAFRLWALSRLPSLKLAAEEAALAARYSAAQRDGVGIAQRILVPVTFNPGQSLEAVPDIESAPRPQYPSSLRAQGVRGTVLVEVLVGTDGRVEDARIVKSVPQMDPHALETARGTRFYPAVFEGERVPIWLMLSYVYEPH